MEILQKKPFIIVDFAHTAASLQAALDSLTPIKPNIYSRIITVFGCAGLRDKARRKMGQVSAKLADFTVITAEDPRAESIEQISEEIAYWAREIKDKNTKVAGHVYIKIPDREEAIKFALQIAKKDDIVYITGKGHETTMCFGTTEVPWSDQKTIAKLIS